MLGKSIGHAMHNQYAWLGALVPVSGRSGFIEAIITNIIAAVVLNAFASIWTHLCRCRRRSLASQDAQRERDREEEASIKRRAETASATRGATARDVVYHEASAVWSVAADALGCVQSMGMRHFALNHPYESG